MSEKKTPKEQYLDAKWVCDNADKFYYRDVALAREFVDGFEAALQVVREEVHKEPEFPGSMPDEMWEIIKNDRHACEKSHRMAVWETKQNILTRIEKLTEES